MLPAGLKRLAHRIARTADAGGAWSPQLDRSGATGSRCGAPRPAPAPRGPSPAHRPRAFSCSPPRARPTRPVPPPPRRTTAPSATSRSTTSSTDSSDRYLARVIEQAQAENVNTLLVRIDTDGGEVHHARTMFKRILDLEAEEIRTVAFVDFRAISAGALIAYAHEEVYIAETASIGDIGVVFQTPEGENQVRPREIRDRGAHPAGPGRGAAGLEPRDAAQDDRPQSSRSTGSPCPAARWSTSSRTTSRSSSPVTPTSTATTRSRSSSTAVPIDCSP